MIPDGVATAALEPMETLEANVAPGAQPPAGEGEGSNQAASQIEEVIGEPMGGSGQGEPAASKEAPPTGKIGNSKISADPKAKSSTKTPTKTKPGATTGPGPRPNTAQSRLTNGVNKSQTNGVAKKTSTTNPGAGDKKSTPTSAASKRPAGSAASPASKTPTKPADRKPLGTTRPSTAPASNGLKSATRTAAAAKKAPTAAPANGVKTAAAAAKKPAALSLAPRPASAAPTKPSSTAAPKTDRTPVSKTTRPSTGTASSRPASAASRPATAGATKSTTPTTKPLTPKPTTPAPRAAASTTPSAGRTPTSLASKTTTPVKKDVTKPATPVAKKPAASPLTRPASAKTAKPDTPKSASKPDSSATKKPAASKATETKTKPKTQETKPAPTKTPTTKPAAAKSSSPKKAVGSSTPMPVKRGPKPTTAGESEAKEDDSSATVAAAAVASAAAAVTLATAEEEKLVSTTQAQPEPEPAAAAVAVPQLSAQLDLVHLGGPADDLTSPLGTTVMSPPCSPPGPMSPVREPQRASLLLDPHAQHEPWSQSQSQEMRFQQEEDEKENLLIPTSTAAAGSFSMMGPPDLLGTSPVGGFTSASLTSPSQDKEVAVEKADEEINDDDDDEEEERKAGQQTSSLLTDMSGSQPSEEFHVRSSGPGGSAGWHGEDLLSAMDSEEVSSSTSSRQQGVSEMSSTQHTGLLEGTQSSDALVDSSLRGSEGDANFMGSPNVETLANDEEDEEEEEEEEERVDEMDVSSERADDHHMGFHQREQQQQRRHHHHHEEKEEEDDEDVEMPSEGVTESGLESCGYVDEDEDFNEEERVDNLNRSVGALPPVPPSSAWGQSKPLNPFADPWAQPSLLSTTTHTSSPSPLSDHGAADPETPTMSPAQAWLDMSGHSLVPEAALEPHHQVKTGAEASAQLAAPAVGMSQSSTLSGTALAAHSSSETSTPEELQDYDSSSGVESRSDKQQTPVPASVQPDMEQDLGIHLERGDGEEEEAETLPADEMMGTGPPTAPASAPSSPSTSGDEASDTEGEMQINDPDAPLTTEDRAGFDSPPPTRNLPALEEDEEAVDAPAGEGEEDGGGGTPQSANSVTSYGFDCTTSNSNAHSTAESCGKSPGIFSLENEDQLPEEAKDPSFIKELTLPAAAAAYADDLLVGPVDLLPLSHPGEGRAGLDDHHHYMLGGKMGADGLEEVDPLEPSLRLGGQHAGDSSDGYYSAICDKTDSFLAGEENICADPDDDDDYEEDVESDQEQQSESVPTLEEQHANQQNQNLSSSVPIANGHYLAEVPGNRRPIDPVLAASFSLIVPPPPANNNNNNTTHTTNKEGGGSDGCAGGQLRRLEQHQEHLREVQHRQEQERQKRQWLEEERQRLEQQKQLEQQRRELLQLQLQQQQQEHRHRRQVLQWQLELEQQHCLQQKQMQQQQQARRSLTGVMLSPSTGLCTIYEAMETSEEDEEEDEEAGGEQNGNRGGLREKGRCSSNQTMTTDSFRRMRPVPPQDLDWSQKVDMVQQLINQTLLLSGDGGCPPLLLLPVGTGGTLSPLESSMWPSLLPPFSPSSATVTSVSSYSPDSQGSSFPGDWTVVEVETQH